MIRKQQKQKKKIDPYVIRRWAIIVAILLVVVFTGVNVWLAKNLKVERAVQQAQVEKGVSADSHSGKALIGGEFKGTSHHNTPFAFSDSNGTLRLVFFGFTHCPDICPTALATISAVQEALGDSSVKVTPIFVTVDVKRDTPEVMKSYISSFHPSIVGVTSDKAQLKEATDAFKVYHTQSELDEHGDYIVDHSGFVYLMDANGEYIKHFAHSDSIEEMVLGIKKHL